MTSPLTVLGICGSLRRDSYNAAALRAAQELAPEGLTIQIADISHIPLYNEDLRKERPFPPVVEAFREQIRSADALLFSSPEYNYSVPGVLKNAIDWASREKDQPFSGKAAAIMGASPGLVGTARMQYDLRKIGVFLNLQFLSQPEIMIAQAADRFDASGKLIHDGTRDRIGKMLVALAKLTQRLKS